MRYADMNQRPRLIAGLRALAAFLEAHPEVPAPHGAEISVFTRGTDDAMRAEVDRIAALAGSQINAEDLSRGHYRTEKDFGPVSYSAIAILKAARARHNALMSYSDAVIPDTTEEM